MNLPEDISIQKHLTDIHIQRWYGEELFHTEWWLLIALYIAVILIWWVLVRKERLQEISMFAILALIVFLGLDEYGEELTLWDYPVDIIPLFPPLSSLNTLIIPLGLSLLYQYFPSGKSYAIASGVQSAVMCFIIEPALTLVGLYKLIHWHYYESLPVYFLMAIILRMIITKIGVIMGKHNAGPNEVKR